MIRLFSVLAVAVAVGGVVADVGGVEAVGPVVVAVLKVEIRFLLGL